MKLIIDNTNIYDLDLFTKIDQQIKSGFFNFKEDEWYILEVIFHVNQLKDVRLEEYYNEYVNNKPTKSTKSKNDEKYHDYLGYVIKQIHKVFETNKSNIDFVTIAGEVITNENSIIISLEKNEQFFRTSDTNKRGRKTDRRQMEVCSIVPSRPNISGILNKFLYEKLNKRFNDYLEIGGTEVMSQILDINNTNDTKVLFHEFVNQYAHLWGNTGKGQMDELHDKFVEKAEYIWNKYYSDNEKNQE